MVALAYTYPDEMNKFVGVGLGVIVYAASTGPTVANITDAAGTAIATAALTLDATTGLCPTFTSDQMPVWVGASATSVRYKANPLNPTAITLLNAATAVGAGVSTPIGGVYQVFAQASVGGTALPTSFSINLETSFDNTTWFPAATITSTAAYTQVFLPAAAKWVRGSLTALTGGTAPTVTLKIFR